MTQSSDISLTGRLAESMLTVSFDALGAELQEQAKRLLLDLLGVALAGSKQRELEPLHDLVQEWGGKPESTVWGKGGKLPSHAAACINGGFAHAIELDDTHRFTCSHVGATVIPTALALAESTGADGKTLLKAIIVGYETFLRIALAVSPEHRFMGFHTTATVGVFGAAMASAVLLGLDRPQTIHALGLAGTQAAGLFQFQFDGCSAKRFHAGRSAQSGIFAAKLAQKGFSGSPEILEGPYGFGKVMSTRFDPKSICDGLGEQWHLMEMGIKPHSACRFCHAPIDAALALRRHPAWEPTVLEDLELVCSRQLLEQTGNALPTTPMGAQLSTPNAVALALLRGANMPEDVEQHFADPEVCALAGRLRLTVDESLPRTSRQVCLKARFSNAPDVAFSIPLPKGEPENPLTLGELQDKFLKLSTGVLGETKAKTLLQAVDNIETARDMRTFMPLLCGLR